MTCIEPIRNMDQVLGDGLRLTAGVAVLNEWADQARQIELNAVSDALFALLDRSVYRDYEVIDDPNYPRELVVVVREALAIRVRLHDVATFGILFIGQPVDALAPFGNQQE